MFAKIPYPHSCEHMHCEHRQDGICILQNTRDNRGKIIGCDRGETRLMYENGKIPITNADRIRSMSDEELAVFFAKVNAALCRADLPIIAYRGETVNDNLDWLWQPAETEGTK